MKIRTDVETLGRLGANRVAAARTSTDSAGPCEAGTVSPGDGHPELAFRVVRHGKARVRDMNGRRATKDGREGGIDLGRRLHRKVDAGACIDPLEPSVI